MKQTIKSFVLAQPAKLTAPEVVQRAARAGITLKPHSVHVIRSVERRRLKDEKSARTRPEVVADSIPVPIVPAKSERSYSLEEQFVDLACELGLLRSEELLHRAREVRNAFIARA